MQGMLATGDEKTLFNGDLNGFVNNVGALLGSSAARISSEITDLQVFRFVWAPLFSSTLYSPTQITALQMASMAGQTECVALLLKAKARRLVSLFGRFLWCAYLWP